MVFGQSARPGASPADVQPLDLDKLRAIAPPDGRATTVHSQYYSQETHGQTVSQARSNHGASCFMLFYQLDTYCMLSCFGFLLLHG